MPATLRKKLKDKYFWMELVLLVSITYLISIISDVEYSFYEEGNGWFFIRSLEYRLSFGTFSFTLFATYYWGFVKRFVDKKQPLFLFISVIVFIPVMHYYNHYVSLWGMSKLPFLSESLRDTAARQFKAQNRFSLVYAYTLSSRCLPMIGFAYLIRSLKQEALVKTLKEQQLISELNYLKAQMQPHFFFNTLNNIYALAIKQSDNTAPMVLQLSEMMRYILYQSPGQKVALKKEIAFLSNYVEIERIRHHQHISIGFDLQGITDAAEIEPLLLLPFIENAFKHGAREVVEKGTVSIVLCLVEKDLSLQVTNSKPITRDKNLTCGIGLQNVKKRLDLLYHGRHQLQVSENAQQYEVNLNLQLA